jgi:hypothetical protein
MEDLRKYNRGQLGNKGGRRPKAEELKLVEKLKNFDDLAQKAMETGLKNGDYQFWNKFMEYRYGKPKDRVDITSNDESINIPVINFFNAD